MAHILQHPVLGHVTGIENDGVIRFLGVQYANLKDRFAAPVVKDDYSSGAVNATKFGPTVITPPESCDIEQGLFQQTLPKPEFPGISDLRGLNLNITIPRHTTNDTKLPVLVFIHGGGPIGGNWFPQTNFGRLVEFSSDIGRPIIGVNINYRVGAAGYLISTEMQERGYVANRSLLDQKAAFKWLAKHIEGFGGDPNNITAMGESAGAACAMHLLFSDQPLFRRLILHGGTTIGLSPIPEAMMEASYWRIASAFGLEQVTPDERLHALLSLPPEDLLTKLPPGVNLNPSIDGKELANPLTFQSLVSGEAFAKAVPGVKWCNELMVGNCQLDSMVFAYIGMIRKTNIAERFIKAVSQIAPSRSAAEELLSAYNITPDLPDSKALIPVLSFINELKWGLPAARLAAVWPHKSYFLNWDELNTWEGEYKGHATHGLELVYLFMNYNEKLSERQREIAESIATDHVNFVHGQDPWIPFEQEKGARVYGPSDRRISEWIEYGKEDDGRTARVEKLIASVGLEQCTAIADLFMFGG